MRDRVATAQVAPQESARNPATGLRDASAYDIEKQGILDDESGRIRVRWRQLSDEAPRLVPEGLRDMIDN